MCQLGDPGAVFYLYVISKVDLDFSACNNSPTIQEDGYSILDNANYGADVDVRCRLDSGGLMGNAVGAVYSSTSGGDRENAYEFCRNMGGYDFN